MNTQTDTTVNPMQVTEALPLEDNSLPAAEVLADQQAEFSETSNFVFVFVP